MIKFVIIFASAVLFLILLSAAAGYALFVSVLDQKPRKKQKEKEKKQNKPHGENPQLAPTGGALNKYMKPLVPKMDELPLKLIETVSFDGLRLCGYLLEGRKDEVVILVHGYRSCWKNDFADKIRIYRERGSTVLFIDQRSHGNSEGRYIGFSELEKYDLEKWVGEINMMYENPRIYLHGVSMGGASVIHTADMKLKNVKGIIDDCGYDSIDNLTKSIIKQNFHVPFFPIGTFASMWARLIAGIDFKATIGEECVRNTDLPIVFIHGSDDRFVPCSMSRDLYAACRSPKELLLVENAGHAAAFMMAEEKYTDLVNRLLDGKIV